MCRRHTPEHLRTKVYPAGRRVIESSSVQMSRRECATCSGSCSQGQPCAAPCPSVTFHPIDARARHAAKNQEQRRVQSPTYPNRTTRHPRRHEINMVSADLCCRPHALETGERRPDFANNDSQTTPDDDAIEGIRRKRVLLLPDWLPFTFPRQIMDRHVPDPAKGGSARTNQPSPDTRS